MPRVTVVGAGLAGCEAAFALAEMGIDVVLVEQKPARRSPAHQSDDFAELVCSNSLRAAAVTNAVGLLKEEMRLCGSLVMRAADATKVPAGGALAVDRSAFAACVTQIVRSHPRIAVRHEHVEAIPDDRPLVLATGPLTSDALASDLARVVGASHLAYYDAIAPVVDAMSIDASRVFRQSRYDKGETPDQPAAYVNCPFEEAEYHAFIAAILGAEKVAPRAFEEPRYFEGCLPIEVLAERGPMTLAFGPMKPVGLVDPRTNRRPFAVVQLRPEDAAHSAYNLVGFQTRMKHADQLRVLRMIPGLGQAVFFRLGSVHRNTFLDAPHLLDATMQLRALPGVYVAGQLSGIEGYAESAASGLLCGILLGQKLLGASVSPPPPTTALGGLLGHLSRNPEAYQPSNITWAHMPPFSWEAVAPTHAPPENRGKRRLPSKGERYAMLAERALCDVRAWAAQLPGVEHRDKPVDCVQNSSAAVASAQSMASDGR